MDPKTFGAFIQSQRKAKGLTQADLAEKLHVTDKAVSRWERGVGFPEVTLLEPLANALGVTLLELMQSRKCMADTLSTGEAEAAVAGALTLAQEKRKRIYLWLSEIGACLGILAVMIFLFVTLMRFVDVLWVRSASTYLTLTCASLAMDGVTQNLRRRADPEDPRLKRSWQFYAARLLTYIGGGCLILSIAFVSGLEEGLRETLQLWGFLLTGGGCLWLLATEQR